MSLIIASYSVKGGVGKTTTAVNLAYCVAREGYRTLLWDLDPQGAASYTLRVRPRVKGGAQWLLEHPTKIGKRVKQTHFDRLDLLPADTSYRQLDLDLDAMKKPRQRVRKLLEPLASSYHMVFVDCPPNLTLLAENVFRAADVLLVPLIPTPLSIRALEQLDEFLCAESLRPRVLPFFSMVDARKGLHQQVMAALPGRFPHTLIAHIPYLVQAELMAVERAPVASFAPRSRIANAYESLWAEIKTTLANRSAISR